MAAQSEVRTTSRLAQLQHLLMPEKLNQSWAGRRLIEALSNLPPNKFGSTFDVRYQQKQQQEREMKKMEIVGEKLLGNSMKTIPDDTTTAMKSLNSTGTGGKVRQMFDERRRTTGIDRSFPLKPIVGATTPTGSITARSVGSNRQQQAASIRQANNLRRSIINQNTKNQMISNSNDATDSKLVNGSANRTKKDICSQLQSENDLVLAAKKLSRLNLKEGGDAVHDGNSNTSAKSPPQIKLNPLLVKKTPTTSAAVSKSPSVVIGPAPYKAKNNRPSGNLSTESNITQKRILGKVGTTQGASSSQKISKQKTPIRRIATPPAGMVACKICHRHFNEERIGKHEQVCQKMATKKRKIFDATQHRVKGTEAEKYIQKANTTGSRAPAARPLFGNPTLASAKKSNWRKQHEEFIEAIRAAKKVQTHLAKGGKLSDLPPPPPSENPDYIQCPHCQRRFNEAAASRHIPKCATMLHNKRKPALKKK